MLFVVVSAHSSPFSVHVLALHAFLTGAILKRPSLQKCVVDVCACMFHFIFVGIDSVDLRKGLRDVHMRSALFGFLSEKGFLKNKNVYHCAHFSV